jgi:hypothetical protein
MQSLLVAVRETAINFFVAAHIRHSNTTITYPILIEGVAMKLYKKLVAFVLAMLAMFSVALPSQAAGAGDLDLAYYCENAYSKSAKVVLMGENPTADSWRCLVPLTKFMTWPSQEYPISMNEVCRMEHGDYAYAATSDEKDPYAWKCYN